MSDFFKARDRVGVFHVFVVSFNDEMSPKAGYYSILYEEIEA